MDEYEVQQLINRVVSGYVHIGDYIIDIPPAKLLAEADNIYNDTLYNNRFEVMLRDNSTELLLLKHKIWSFDEKKELAKIPDQIDQLKLQLYHNIMVPSTKEKIKQNLEYVRNRYNGLMTQRSYFDRFTLEHFAELTRERYIFSNIILNKKYKPITVSGTQLDKIIADFKKNYISNKKYRLLARNDAWTNIWDVDKLKCFRKIGDEQRYLVGYTKLYQNIMKHPECPNDMVLNDDDALDGWLMHIKAEQKKERDKKRFPTTKDKPGAIYEQFIIAKTQEDIDSIVGMNDIEGKMIQRQIHNMVKKDGKANEYSIPEIRQKALVKKI